MTHVGGRIETSGEDPAIIAVLTNALSVGTDEELVRRHVHGFHSYAARMHPDTARSLVEGLTERGQTVLDPFCGSGTVLVEALLAGRAALGVDANPLAVELSRLKTRAYDDDMLREIVDAARRTAAHAEDRRAAKMGPTRRYEQADRSLFDVHVLLELDGLKSGLEAEQNPEIRGVLGLVLSSILVKVSRSPGDTAESTKPRRLAGGFTIRTFVRKTEELAKRLREFREGLPPGTRQGRVLLGDARDLEGINGSSVDAIVTSPPYPGVYDYYSQHASRLRWLGLDAAGFERSEVGARRRLERLPYARALAAWEGDVAAFLCAMQRVLRPEAPAAIIMADGVLSGKPVHADRLIRKLAQDAGFSIAATASQQRPHFHGPSRDAFRTQPRREHVFVIRAPLERPRSRAATRQ